MFLINTAYQKTRYNKIIFFVLLVTLVSLAFSIRFLNSVSVISLAVLIFLHPDRSVLIKRSFTNVFFLSLLALFLMQIGGLLYTHDMATGWKEVTKKAGLIGIPFFFCAIRAVPSYDYKRLMTVFSISLVLVSLVCLGYASFQYVRTGDSSVFFYHDLVSVFEHHAIFFSFFLFYCILFWMEEGFSSVATAKQKRALLFMLVFFLAMIFLLSSKLVIGIVVLYLFLYAARHFFRKKNYWLIPVSLVILIIGAVVLFGGNNPVKKRFFDLAEGNSRLFQQEKFSPGIYFNGLQFRLLTWRFTYEILQQRQAWALGVSPGDAQNELNKRYTETNMYLGDGKGDTGLWNFNCHNVYLQTTLESGIVGLVFLLSAMAAFFRTAIRKRQPIAIFFFLSIFIFGFTESFTSSQYTILLFLFFPLLALKAEKTGSSTDTFF